MSTVPSWPKEDAEYHLTRAQYETLRAIDIAIGAHDFWFRGGPMYKFQFGRKRPGHCVIKQVYGGQSEFARGPDWRHESPFLPYGWKTVNPHGTASLKDTAIRVFMSDQSLLELKHFEVIPYFLADYIWKRLGEWYVSWIQEPKRSTTDGLKVTSRLSLCGECLRMHTLKSSGKFALITASMRRPTTSSFSSTSG